MLFALGATIGFKCSFLAFFWRSYRHEPNISGQSILFLGAELRKNLIDLLFEGVWEFHALCLKSSTFRLRS